MTSGSWLTVRSMERLRSLSEQECYLRCYGWSGGGDTVKLVASSLRHEPDRRREQSEAGERLRRVLGLRIDALQPLELVPD